MGLKKAVRVLLVVTVCVIVFLISVFLIGRFGWKLGGFEACQGAGIEKVEVTEDTVKIEGFYPGSFPEGFIGYYSREADGKLYIGFRFSAVFGFFETGDFSISIPVKNHISEVVVKTSTQEYSIWTENGGQIAVSEQYGIFIRLDYPDAQSISVSYCGKTVEQPVLAWENGEYVYFDCDIMMEAKNAETPIPFLIELKGADGRVIADRKLLFAAETEKMYLRITEAGEIED